MSRLLLDSSAYSAFMRGHPGVTAVVREASELMLSSVVLGELLTGFKQGSRYEKNRGELDRFLASPRARLLVVTDQPIASTT